MTQEQQFQIKGIIECLKPGSRRMFFEHIAKDKFSVDERLFAHCIIDAIDRYDQINPKDVCVEAVQYATGINILEDMKCRQRKLVDARRIYFALRMRMHTKGVRPDTAWKIGRELGKDHATFLHNKQMHFALMEVDSNYREKYERAAEYLNHKLNGTEIPQQNEDRQDDSAAC